MDKTQYEYKIQDFLKDKNTYKFLPRNPINNVQTKLNNIITNLHNTHVIDFKTSKFLISYNQIAPTFCVLPKTHRANVPLRSICSCIQYVFHNTSTFLEN